MKVGKKNRSCAERVYETPEGQRVKCEACGGVIHFGKPNLCPSCGRTFAGVAFMGMNEPWNTPENNHFRAVFFNTPRCQHNLRPGLRHAHGPKR